MIEEVPFIWTRLPIRRKYNSWLAAVIIWSAFLYKPTQTTPETKNTHFQMWTESNTSFFQWEHEPLSRADKGGAALHQTVLQQISQALQGKGSPFFFHMGIARKGEGGGCKGLSGWFRALFSHIFLGVYGLARMVCGTFFPWLPIWQREGVFSYLGNAHIESPHFKKGLPNERPSQKKLKLWTLSVLGGTRQGWTGKVFFHRARRGTYTAYISQLKSYATADATLVCIAKLKLANYTHH